MRLRTLTRVHAQVLETALYDGAVTRRHRHPMTRWNIAINDLRMIGLISLVSGHDDTSYSFRLTDDGLSLAAWGELFRNLARLAGVTLPRRLSSTQMLVLIRALTHGGEVMSSFGHGAVSWNFAISLLVEMRCLTKVGRRIGSGSVDVFRITENGAAFLCGAIPFMLSRMAARLLPR